MIAVLAVLWAAVGVGALIWLVLTGRLGRRNTPDLQGAHRRAPPPAAAGSDAEWIYGDRARRTPRPSPEETEERARSEAAAIVGEAELKAREIVAAAKRDRSQVEAELTRERADLAEKSRRLAEFLTSALEEVERTSANGSRTAGAHDLDELEALQDELRRAD